ncbi:MAG: flagellar filament capping protein FliD [Bacteroides sp.]
MAIRLSGINSGLDTDAIVQALVSSYSLTKTNLEKSQTKLSWTQDAWKSMNTKVYSFYTGKLSAMRLSSSYSKKAASVSNSSVAKVTASSSAVNGNQKLVVKQLASAGYLTGGVISAEKDGVKAKVKGDTKLADIKGMEDYANGGTIKVKANASAAEKTISLSADMTMSQFVVKLKEAGLSANFDEGNQRIFINSKTSGKNGEFLLEGADGNGTGALNALGLLTADEAKSNYSTVANWTDSDIVAYSKAAYDSKVAGYNESIKKLLATNDSLKKSNETTLAYRKEYAQLYQDTLVYEDSYDADGKLVSQSPTADSRKQAAEKLEAEIKRLEESDRKKELEEKKKAGTELNETETAELEEFNGRIAAAKQVVGGLANDTILISRTMQTETDENGNETQVLGKNDIDKYIEGIADNISANEAKIAANLQSVYDMHKKVDSNFDENAFDVTNPSITAAFAEDATVDDAKAANSSNSLATDLLTAYKAQRDEAIAKVAEYEAAQLRAEAGTQTEADEALLGIGSGSGTAAVRITGQDSVIELNGATFTSNTNNFSINGLTIQALSVNSADEPVTITTDTDVDGIYNMIKDFFKEYNEVVNYMAEKYNATSAKGYEPLTDDEKEAMTDSEIEKWETKIKDSLLRKDNTLSTISNEMKSNMLKSYEINGTKYNLTSFGISTLGYFEAADNERGAFHIAGDADDTYTSGKEDKLRAAIAKDPDTVVEFFSKLTAEVYNDLTSRMKGTSLRSAYTLYNDKQMNREYSNYTTKISEWEDKITEKEDYYYKKFSAMESALAKLNSQQSSMTGFFG